MASNWWWFALGSAAFAAATALFGKLGVAHLPSNLATAYRTVVALMVALAIVSLRQEWQRPAGLAWRDVAALTASGVCTGLSWLCYYRALQMAPVSRVAPVDKLSVVLVIALSWLLLGERISPMVAAGGALIAIGAVLVAIG